MKEDTKLANLKLRVCKIKMIDCFIYLAITIALCLAIIFKWEMCRYIACMALAFVAIFDLVIENLLYKDFIFFHTKEDNNEKQ